MISIGRDIRLALVANGMPRVASIFRSAITTFSTAYAPRFLYFFHRMGPSWLQEMDTVQVKAARFSALSPSVVTGMRVRNLNTSSPQLITHLCWWYKYIYRWRHDGPYDAVTTGCSRDALLSFSNPARYPNRPTLIKCYGNRDQPASKSRLRPIFVHCRSSMPKLTIIIKLCNY